MKNDIMDKTSNFKDELTDFFEGMGETLTSYREDGGGESQFLQKGTIDEKTIEALKSCVSKISKEITEGYDEVIVKLLMQGDAVL